MISLSGIYLKIAHFPVKIGLIGGVGGVPEIRFSLESSSFCYLGAHAKFHNPSCLLSGRKGRASEEERRKKKNNAKYYGHYVYASSHGQRTHSNRTKIVCTPRLSFEIK